jgi:uncharacterized protein with von Willebrand factor type A (vWA) domain
MVWRYSRFDGTQQPIDLDAEDILAAASEDLLYHGDINAALRRLLQQGFATGAGQHVEGLQQMLQRIAARREELAAQRNDLAEQVAAALEEILATERQAIATAEETADLEADPAARRATRDQMADRRTELDLLPPGLTGQIGALMGYSFVSEEAAAAFAALVDELRRELVQGQLDQAAGQMAAATPEERAHLREGLAALNAMLEQRGAGEELDPSFAQFMEEFGDLFPGEPADLDELLSQLGQRMAAASSLVASMTPDQRAQLAQLSEQLMADMDLAWQLDRLGANLRDALPELSWDEASGAPGDPLSVLGASEAIGQMAELSELEQMLRDASEPGRLAEVDPERVAELLGPDAAESLRVLAQLTTMLEEAGLVGRRGGRLALTPAGLRRLGAQALRELFARLRRDRFGHHQIPVAGLGHDRDIETKPYEYGDPFRLDIGQTLRSAIIRLAGEATEETSRGIEVPIRLSPEDFTIERTENLSMASTVLCIDLSLSMPMRDNFLAAKKVAMALQSLIASRYPRDYLGLVGFSATAREIGASELAEVSWDFAYGTNLQHALALSRRLLAGKGGTKQVIVITDGEPTAHVMDDGQVFFNYPPVAETLQATLREVARCTREHIVINTFVLDSTGSLRSFVERMTQMNRGRAFYTTPASLGDYLLVDFVEHRSSSTRRRLRPGA